MIPLDLEQQEHEPGQRRNGYLREQDKGVSDTSPEHKMENCGHGFWAYFDSQDTFQSSPNSVSGIIEGYGEVIVGEKGFRSSKARILALTAPRGRNWLGFLNHDKGLTAFMVALNLFLIIAIPVQQVLSVVRGTYLDDLFLNVIVVLGGISLYFNPHSQHSFSNANEWRREWHDNIAAFDRTRSNYQNIPIYSSRREMLDDFPLLDKDKNNWIQK